MNVYCATCILMLAGAVQPDKATIRDNLIARIEGLQNIVVKYDQEWVLGASKRTLAETEELIKKGLVVGLVLGTFKSHEEYWYLDGRMRHEVRLTDETQEYIRQNKCSSPYEETNIDVYTDQKFELLTRYESTSSYHGEIYNPISASKRIDLQIELSLGYRRHGRAWFKASDFENAEIEATASGDVVVSRAYGRRLHKWTYKPNLGYALQSYEIRDINGTDGEFWKLENSDFRNIDGFMLPMKVERRVLEHEDGKIITTNTKIITVHGYSINDSENTPNKYNIAWPNGATVYDVINKVEFNVDVYGEIRPRKSGSKPIPDNVDEIIKEMENAAQLEKEAIRKKLIERLEGLQNIFVKYDLEWIPTPLKSLLELDGKVAEDGGIHHIVKDPVKTHEQYWYLDGRVRHESRLSSETIEFNRKHHSYISSDASIDVFTHQKHESLSHYNSAVGYHGEIYNLGNSLRKGREIQIGLGLKCADANSWLTASDLENAYIEAWADGYVSVSMKVRNNWHFWTCDPNLGYALVLYKIGVHNRWVLKNSDFKNVDGFMLPMKMEHQVFHEEDGKLNVVDTKRFTVHKYSLNHPENTPEKYRIAWPAEARIYDNRNRVIFNVDDAGRIHPRKWGSEPIPDNIEEIIKELEGPGDVNGKS